MVRDISIILQSGKSEIKCEVVEFYTECAELGSVATDRCHIVTAPRYYEL
jgi:hypothetical protein